MEQLQVFKFNSNEVRTVIKDGEPWFVAKDVTDVLEIKNTTDAVKRLEDEEVARFNLGGLSGEANIVNESGLYSLIMASRKPEAKQFKRWVTGEVLPSIRKHGAYMTEDVLLKSLSDPNYVIGLLTALSDSKKELNIKNQLIGELKPKADYLDLILKGKLLMTTSQISKDYGMSAQTFNKILHGLGIQFIQNDQWLLYSKYHAQGYTSSKFIPITRSDGRVEMILNTQWTQKGRMFLYETLKENDILPMIERREN